MRDSLEVVLTSGLQECPRCGESHDGPLDWHEFARPPEDESDPPKYWAPCPTNGDPILLAIYRGGPSSY